MTTNSTKVINIRKKELQKIGYNSLQEWLLESDSHVYIGRNMEFYVPGAKASVFKNPYSAKKYGREGCIAKYKEYLESRPELVTHAKKELTGKTLGCWCKPEACHGDVLVDLCNKTP